ncbi:MAG: ATP-binding protein [Minisyncoccia bacterium]
MTIPFLGTYSKEDMARMLALFVITLATAQIGRFLFTAPAVIQPAAGLALAALVIFGIRLWPAVALAAAVNSLVISGSPIIVAIGGALAHSLHAVLGASALRAFNFDPVFRRVRDMFLFIFTALIAAMIVPTVGIGGILLNNALLDPDFAQRSTWLAWWAGIMIGDLVIASVLIRWLAKKTFTRTHREIAELVAAFAIFGGLSYILFWTDAPPAARSIVLLLYFVPFIWFSLRLGTRFTLLAFLMTSVIGLTGVLYGNVPSESPLAQRIITTEFFLATLAVIFSLFTAVVEERKRAAREVAGHMERLQELLTKVQAADRAKSEFIAVFAHELRNPLAPMVSAIELMKLKWANMPEIASVVDVLDDRSKTVVRLLDDLLDVSRISQQKFKLRLEEIDVRKSIENVGKILAPYAEKHGLTFRVSTPPSRVIVSADPIRFEQVVTNLLMNAIKYTDTGGTISVALRAEGDEAVVRVRDTGIGIAPEMLSRIFLPFAGLGVEQRQRTVKEGLGIGLWLTENLVRTHGGKIEAKSEGAGHGAEFVIRFPLIKNEAPSFITHTFPMNTDKKLRILVVDDNEQAANSLSLLLQHVGNSVEVAYVGGDVAEKVLSFQPDAVVLDIGLPDVSGYDVARELRAGGYGGRIIALTGYGQEEDKRKAEEAGFDYHLTKPVGIADLLAVLVRQPA